MNEYLVIVNSLKLFIDLYIVILNDMIFVLKQFNIEIEFKTNSDIKLRNVHLKI